MGQPVLETIRAILKFKDYATISETAKMAGMTQKAVLDVINENGEMVWRNRKNGHITKVDPRGVLLRRLVESDAYYFPDTYGAWSVEGKCLRFKGHDDLRDRLRRKVLVGALGDCWNEDHVMDTPENRAELEAAGIKLWSEDEADDRLWCEARNDAP